VTRGRPVRGFFAGLLLGILIDIDLAFSGAVQLDSVWLTILPIALIVIGLALGFWAPIGRKRAVKKAPPSPLPPPVAWPESAPIEGATITTSPNQWATPPPPIDPATRNDASEPSTPAEPGTGPGDAAPSIDDQRPPPPSSSI
jgi:hypothetical protein